MELKDWKKFAQFLGIVTRYRGQDITVIRQYFWLDVWHDTEITLREIGEITGGQTSGSITNGIKSLRAKESINCKYTAQQKQKYKDKKEIFLKLIETKK